MRPGELLVRPLRLTGHTVRVRAAHLAAALALLAAGCRREVGSVPPPPPPSDAPADSLLRNLAYAPAGTEGRRVLLRAGRFDDPQARVNVTWVAAAYGDLDGDRHSDAVVHLASNTGGSGVFSDLVPVLASGDSLRSGRATRLGDRVRVDSFLVTRDTVRVVMVTQGPGEPMCCGTRHETRDYVLRGDSLGVVRITHVATRDTAINAPTR
jgi:hypothetical protein